MSEDTQEDTSGESAESELSPAEQEAQSQGWVPKEQYQGDEHKWVDAGEFIRRGELFKKIEEQNRVIKDTRKALTNFQEHYSKVKETEYNRALASLKQAYKAANREQEFDRADMLEAEIEKVENEAEAFKEGFVPTKEVSEVHPEFAAWANRNEWYSTQGHMRKYADDFGVKLSQQGVSPSEVLKQVEQAVRKEFPTRFKNPNQDRVSAVEGGATRTTGKSNDSFKLSEQEEKIMNNLVRSKVMTKEEYIKDIKSQRGVK